MNSFAPLETILSGLAASGEVTRLRLLMLLAEAELTVSELVSILGQSQPRISRHLKLLVEAGLVDRHREGAWVFFRLAERGIAARMARQIVDLIDKRDPVAGSDQARLSEVRQARAEQAAQYFASQARNWDQLRSLHVPEDKVERAVRALVGDGHLHAVLDLGTGTGRMLELVASFAERAVGVDQSPAMLNVARTRLEAAGLKHVQLRQGDLYALPVESDGYDLIIIHQVLHYLDDPGRALREAARRLSPGGRLLVVDFSPHLLEFLREEHKHRRLGFTHEEIIEFMRDAGLDLMTHQELAPNDGAGKTLTVSIWVGRDRRVRIDDLSRVYERLA